MEKLLARQTYCTHKEIAAALDISPSTLRVYLLPFRAQLRAEVGYVPGQRRIFPRQLRAMLQRLAYLP